VKAGTPADPARVAVVETLDEVERFLAGERLHDLQRSG